MADWAVTKENNPARGDYFAVRRNGERIGSAPTKASARRLMKELAKERGA